MGKSLMLAKRSVHEAVHVEFPILVAVGAEPLSLAVVPLVGEATAMRLSPERPKLLDQSIVELARPFARKERDDLIAPLGNSDRLRQVLSGV